MDAIINFYYENNAKRLKVMVDKVLFKLKFDVDKDDFYSLANEIFVQVLKRYDRNRDFDDFLYSCLLKKFKTEMTRLNRIKRGANKNSISIYTEIGDCLIMDTISNGYSLEDEIFNDEDEMSLKTKNFIDTLSPLQKKIVMYIGYGLNVEEISKELNISLQHCNNLLKRIIAKGEISLQ